MEKYKEIDDKIRLGYEHVKRSESIEACDIWLDAWEDIKGIYYDYLLQAFNGRVIFALHPSEPSNNNLQNYISSEKGRSALEIIRELEL